LILVLRQPHLLQVTTEDPGVDGLVRSTTTNDVNYGTRVAIGGSCNDWWDWLLRRSCFPRA
jgi:hypothetical protein